MKGRVPNTRTVLQAVGWVTFLEIIRDRVLYNIILCASLLLALGVLASKLTVIHPERVILDFGLSAVMISCCTIAVFTGSGLLGKEIERRTLYVALSRPITRTQFILGKFLGLVFVLVLNWGLLVLSYLMIVGYSSENGRDWYSPILWVALMLTLIASFLMASLAVFFSSFSTASLSVIFSLGMYLIGNNITQIRLLAEKSTTPLHAYLLKILARILPNFENFSLGTRVSYALPVDWAVVCFSVLYGFFMVGFFLLLGGVLVQNREV